MLVLQWGVNSVVCVCVCVFHSEHLLCICELYVCTYRLYWKFFMLKNGHTPILYKN